MCIRDSPKGEPLAKPESLPYCQGLALWERWHHASDDGEGKPAYNSLNAFNIRSPVSPLFSGWNWVPYTLPALTTPVTGME